MNHNTTSWLELNTYHPESAIDFYSETLGWDFESTSLPEGGTYWVAHHNDMPVGGVFDLGEVSPNQSDQDFIPSHWMTYMHVKDIDKAQALASKAGGVVARPALHLDGVGKLAVITDSAGALVGLIETDKTAKANLV